MRFYKLVLIFVFLILISGFVRGDLVFDEVLCKKDGSLNLKVYSDDDKIYVNDIEVIVEKKDPFLDFTILKFKVNGSWSKDYISDEKVDFKSRVAQINEPGVYNIVLDYIDKGVNKKTEYEIECPGLIFSCELVNVDIKNCTNVDNK